MALIDNKRKIQALLDGINAMPEASDTVVETSDATAESGDIVVGKTAYVNGKKVTGNIEIVTEDQIVDNAPAKWIAEKSAVRTSFIANRRIILENNGANVHLDIPGRWFGDATVADVLAGKKFTSANGLELTGTATSNENTGVTTSVKGSYTPTSDSTATTVYIPHSLGITPNFYFLYARGNSHYSDFAGEYIAASAFMPKDYINSDRQNCRLATTLYGNSDGTDFRHTGTNVGTNECTDTKLYLYLNTRKLKGGVTYDFICGVMNV